MLIFFFCSNCIENNILVEVISKDEKYVFSSVKKSIYFVLKSRSFILKIYDKNNIYVYSGIYKKNSKIKIYYNNHKKCIKLTDYYYPNLPIKEGIIKLWPKT